MNRLGRWRAPLSLYSSAMLLPGLFGGVTSGQVSQAALGSVRLHKYSGKSCRQYREPIAIVPRTSDIASCEPGHRTRGVTQAALLRGE